MLSTFEKTLHTNFLFSTRSHGDVPKELPVEKLSNDLSGICGIIIIMIKCGQKQSSAKSVQKLCFMSGKKHCLKRTHKVNL